MSVLDVARAEVGYIESGGPHGNDGNVTKYWQELEPADQGEPWCAAFVSWVFKRAGNPLPDIDHIWGYSFCPDAVRWFKAHGAWTTTPEPGYIVLYQFPGYRESDHTGIVEAVNADGTITTIEGNTSPDDNGSQNNGGGVYRRRRATTYVLGYGIPPGHISPSPEEDDVKTYLIRSGDNSYTSDLATFKHWVPDGDTYKALKAAIGEILVTKAFIDSLPTK